MDWVWIGAVWIGVLLLLWLPGVALQRLLRIAPHPDWLVAAALQVGLGMAWWPLLLLWGTAAALTWSPPVAQMIAAATLLGGAAALLWAPRATWRRRMQRLRRQALTLTLWGCVAVLAAGARLVQVRGLALPAWVDSVQHVALLRLIVEQGRVPATLDPVIPGGALTYHWGYHALLAWLAWLGGVFDAFALADLTLLAGQCFNALSVLMLYAAGRVLFASRRAGLLAAAAVAAVTWFPAYFTAWGRYTHLVGVLLLVPTLIALWRLRQRMRWGDGVAAALMVGGVALVHVRIAFFGAVLLALLGLGLLVRGRWRPLLLWVAAAAGGMLLTLPWWLTLLRSTWVQALIVPRAGADAAWTALNTVDWAIVWAPRGELALAVASAGLSALFGATGDLRWLPWLGLLMVLGCGALIAWSWRRPGLRRLTLATWARWMLVWGWAAAVLLLLQLDRFGLPPLRFSHVNAAVMTLFLPTALTGGGLLAWAVGLLAPRTAALYVAGSLALAASLWGAPGLAKAVNPATILALPADRAALKWVRDHVPADARFAVNVWQWNDGIYAGSDGGSWLPVLAARASILPPVLYAGALPDSTVAEMNDLFALLEEAADLDAPELQARLAAAGVTHLYLGARGNGLQPEAIDSAPYARLVYRQDGVSIYALRWSFEAQ